MAKLLHVAASPRCDRSHSLQVASSPTMADAAAVRAAQDRAAREAAALAVGF